MKILVTGGNGFIGRYVQSRCEELRIEVSIFDTSIDITHDVTDYEALRDFASGVYYAPDAIIHLAGMLGTHELWDTAEDAIDVNIKGALNVARLALAHGAKLVSIEQPHIWVNVYEATKFAARRMLTGLYYDEGLNVDFVTAHNAFGPGQAYGAGHPQKILPTFSTLAWLGEPIPIWGDGSQKVNLVYAGDVADALINVALTNYSNPLHHFQAGSKSLMDVERVARIVNAHTQNAAGIEWKDMRRGEQDVPYPEPDGDYSYELSIQMLKATIDSYRPDW